MHEIELEFHIYIREMMRPYTTTTLARLFLLLRFDALLQRLTSLPCISQEHLRVLHIE